jgi:DNA-binding NarL/FixJ family response regulator
MAKSSGPPHGMAEKTKVASSDKASIVVIDHRFLPRDCLVRCLQMATGNAVVAFSSLTEWQEVEKNYPPAAIIILCNHSRRPAGISIERDLSFVSQEGMVVPVVLISDEDDAERVMAALKRGVQGYIPTSFTLDTAIEAIRFVEAGGTFVPASTLTSRPRTGDAFPGKEAPLGKLFTAQQVAVLECLQKGKANKEIAYELSMSEGTVKVHVQKIMKKLNARNRTEVAILINALLGNRVAD